MLTFSAPETHSRDAQTYTQNMPFTREATFRRNTLSREGLADSTEHTSVFVLTMCAKQSFIKWCPGGSRLPLVGLWGPQQKMRNILISLLFYSGDNSPVGACITLIYSH